MNWKLFRFTLKRHLVVLRLLIKNNGAERGALLQKTGEFAHIEKNFWHEPVKFPAEPQLVSVGDNVNIASDVAIVYHDIIPFMINNMEGEKIVTIRWGGKQLKTMFSLEAAHSSCMMLQLAIT